MPLKKTEKRPDVRVSVYLQLGMEGVAGEGTRMPPRS